MVVRPSHQNQSLATHAEERLRVCMVTDFFYPSMGGVENHVYQLSQCLMRLGHKVIIVTHRYGNRCGVRYITSGLKVYYIPFCDVYDRVILPTGLVWLPLFRDILVRERINVVHCHAICTMAAEAAVFADLMGYRCVYTEHSNYGFSNVEDIHINKIIQLMLCAIDVVIAVSYCTKENLCLRAKLHPGRVHVIPNAIDTTHFRPDPEARPQDGTVTIVVVSRLVWRKGTHLLIDVVPDVCRKFHNVRFLIAGEGPKRMSLEEMLERQRLHGRVELLGAVAHADIARVLARGHIFLNTSLTEAFCIAILEAVSCGLVVVSTKVGGVPEVLPRQMLNFAEPTPAALADALAQIIPFVHKTPPADLHGALSRMYSWQHIAQRTESVYRRAMEKCAPVPFRRKLQLAYGLGPVYGKIAVLLIVLQSLLVALLEWLWPAASIEPAPEFSTPAQFDPPAGYWTADAPQDESHADSDGLATL